ncbi:bifunctional [glutamine synthetase] adenylyltransferase/[glutamine synthetase]-adenylyl-L-tyrosine phosphorylase [Siculibacillus lacustris]|uniref:Bifunctional glutamine synthetase adenylyltransferase/adenylyl-removing enzyme n=1 Tax=Siculibacillus lacustris TaxID=1549641 RepID=A0A4Q9VXF1_9HYPH|nr:bifunctional [glutamine synthetase] adenylyltransferase/[glutamine synthetase]-adenylyl-L-tyrosine phosphorylase [Siculibacillus lacustris]TBW40961.1 bifunctional [glutamine synthetase] adenylyltransferase/[glutamine synthetase]-adenylyl-L-tyrosine phosphorylase [Siculibacillus lacustris]
MDVDTGGDAGALIDRIVRPLAPGDRKAAEIGLSRVLERAAGPAGAPFRAALAADPRIRRVLLGVFGNSPHLTDLAMRDPARLARILASDPAAILAELVAAADGLAAPDEAALMTALRHIKQGAALTIALADLGGVWDIVRVTDALTRLADATLGAAVRFCLADAVARGKLILPDPADPAAGSGWVLLGMGKYGAHELNYSSDIDLIVFFDRSRAKLADPDEAVDLFVKLTKRMVKIMQERTVDGYVFRVDLRLRPDPGATPIAMSLDGAFQYYESMGQNWERAALIKARPVAGDLAAGWNFVSEIRPFIWRKYFDYAAIADVHSIKRQIHAHKGHGEIAVHGHNVKLGRGGIREIEFFVQTQQLIAGGRNPNLRGRGTLDMLARLAEEGWIEAVARDELTEAYGFLRNVEHRIQMVADEQSHCLPDDDAGVARIGRMMGFRGARDFAAALRRRLTCVQGHYARLFENAPDLSSGTGNLVFTGDEDDPGTLDALTAMGYERPRDVTAAVRAWHFGRYPATRSTVARERLTELTPSLLTALAATDNAGAAFLAFDRMLAHLPTGVQLFSLLCSHPALLELLALVMGVAPKLADTLGRRPHVFDTLMDPAFFDAVPSAADLERNLARAFAEAATYEDLLDRARIFGQEQIFLVGVRVLTGTLSAVEAGVAYATLAEVVVRRLFDAVEAEFATIHGRVPGGRAAVVALGKLGGRETTAASDLDLMLLYDFDAEAEASDGPRPLAPSQYYIRLTQRLIAALSAPTAQGLLYEVDFRLRPSGNKGPMATRLAAFESYHAGDAWTWEHMALTRARVIAGPADFAARVAAAVRTVLARPRDPDRLRADVVEMREMIATEKGTTDPWDIKQVAGGLVDVEFVAQYLMLRDAARDPGVLDTNTAGALRRLVAHGSLDPAAGEELLAAMHLFQGLTQALRLAADGPFHPADVPRGMLTLLARVGELPDFATLEAHLRDTEQRTAALCRRLLGRSRGRRPAAAAESMNDR